MTQVGAGLGGVRLATAGDEAAITALTSCVGFDGAVRLALSREPGANAIDGIRHTGIVARSRDGRLVACAMRVTKTVVCRGKPARLGYLGSLRAARPGTAGAMVRHGFALAGSLREEDELSFDLTSIGSDNAAALRLLTSGARGLPRYLPWAEYETVLLPVPRRIAHQSPAGPSDFHPTRAVVAALESQAKRSVLAEHWTHERLDDARRMAGFRHWLDQDDAVAGLWDLSAHKQARVLGYRSGLNIMRRALGFLPGFSGLPAVGKPLSLGYLAPSAWTSDDAMLEVVRLATLMAFGFNWLVFGYPRDSGLAARIRRGFPRSPRWRSRFFLVAAPGSAGEAEAEALIRAGEPHLEVALL
jgi:hypothetical protein